MERRATGRSAPYGQACLACFKTKCKCVPRPDGDGCERCHRLKRPCHPADALRRRGDKKQSSSDARIAKLEGTIGQLVSLLQSGNVPVGDSINIWSPTSPQQQRPDAHTVNHHQSPLMLTPSTLSSQDVTTEGADGNSNPEDTRSHTTDDAAFGDEDDEDDIDDNAAGASWWNIDSRILPNANIVPLASPPPSTVSGVTVPGAVVSSFSASACLDTFRSRKLHHCPFIYLPAHLTAQQLRRDRPFLFRAIVCVTSSSTDKRARAVELKRVFSETAFLQQSPQQPQQTLDLLLGLLTYIAWGWEHMLSRRSLSRLMVMAVSLVGEMRQDKAMPEPMRTISLLEPRGPEDWNDSTTTSGPATDAQLYLERQRAILGCFVLGSAVSAHLAQIDAPRWTPQMEEGLSAISSNSASCPSDAALAFQVRLQLLATKAAQVRERCYLPDQPRVATLPGPALLYIKSLMGQLQDLRANIPPAFQQHFVLLAQTYYTELCIIETIHLQENPNSILIPTQPPLPTCGPTRVSCFWQSALAIKSCTSTFLTLSPTDLLDVSFVQWALHLRCIAALHHLSVLHEPGWDPATLRTLVDLPLLLTRTAEKLELASAQAGEQASEGVFSKLARGLRTFQSPNHGGDEGELLAQQEEVQVQAGAGAGADVDVDVMAYGQDQAYFSNPTLWLDQFFVDPDEQMIPAL